jgi:hypothetical protein
MRRDPLDQTERVWCQFSHPFGLEAWQSDDADGHLTVLIGDEPTGLHLSISHRTNGANPQGDRYPTWDEIAEARERFLPQDRTFVMHLPPRSEYVAVHSTTFHLWELQAVQRGLVSAP